MTPSSPTDPPPTILVIDDDDSIRSMIEQILTRSRYRVLVAEDGPRGLELFGQSQVACVILDLFMPDMPGEAVLAEIRKLDPSVPVIMITGFAAEDVDISQASAAIYKPFSLARLVDTVAGVLSG
jgi:DNA-binding response OmpR family regulator